MKSSNTYMKKVKTMQNSIEIRNMNKEYDNFTLKNINIDIPNGSIVGLIGENGAGKTTIIKGLMNIIHTQADKIEILGKDYQDPTLRKEVAVVLDDSFFTETLKVKDVNTIMKDFYTNWNSVQFNQYMDTFHIPLNSKISELSKGMRKKLEISTALSHDPKLMILDEPTSGLDPVVRDDILDIFRDFIQDEEHSLLLSSHITSDLENIADYLIFINQGKIIFNEAKDTIMENYGIMRIDETGFKNLDASDIIRYRKQAYSYEVLVSNRNVLKKKYDGVIIDPISIDDLMILYIKGETL